MKLSDENKERRPAVDECFAFIGKKVMRVTPLPEENRLSLIGAGSRLSLLHPIRSRFSTGE